LTGAPPLTSLAVWHPTADHWLHPEDAWSQPAISLSPSLRDRADFEIIDDRMVLDGALDAMAIDHLILAGATWLDEAAWRAAQDWVKEGNVLTVLQREPIPTVEGSSALWRAQAPAAPPKVSEYQDSAVGEMPPAYALPMGAPYAESHLLGPWHDQGHEVRWSHPGSGLALPLAPDTTYELRVAASLPEHARPIEVMLDDETLGRWAPGASGDRRFEFRSRAAGAPYIAQLRFEGRGWTPAEVTESPDTRVLGLYVGGVELREAGAEGQAARPPEFSPTTDIDALWKEAAVPLGKGAVLTMGTADLSPAQRAAVVVEMLAQAGDRLDPPVTNLPVYDPEANGVMTTRFEDKLLYFNPADEDVVLNLTYRSGDFADAKRPPAWEMRLELPARTIREVSLTGGE
jgi:hypothetical protein